MRNIVLIIAMALLFFGCAGVQNVIAENDLKSYSVQKIFELGADRYKDYDYAGAMYYYSNIIKSYAEDLDSVAWANYEIAYIQYIEKNYDAALSQFDAVLAIKSPSQSAQTLAAQMKEKIALLQKK